MRIPVALGCLALLTTGILFLPPIEAAPSDPHAPETVFALVRIVHESNPFPGIVSVTGVVRIGFLFNISDPDQDNGRYFYALFGNQSVNPPTANISGLPTNPLFLGGTGAGRSGWGYYEYPFNFTGNPLWSFAVTVKNGGSQSEQSCSVTVYLRQVYDYDECGRPSILPVQGVSAFVNAEAPSGSLNANISVRYRVSTSDPGTNVSPGFIYRVWADFPQPQILYLLSNGSTIETPGIWHRYVTTPINGTLGGNIRFQIRVIDGITLRQSNMSCGVRINPRILFDAGACGNLPVPSASIGGDVSFPFLDVPEIATELGLETWQAGLLLTGATVATLGIMAISVGGALAGGLFALAAVTFTASLGVLPAWILVVSFMALTLLTVRTWYA